ncbi:MAG: VWA domain-containing protein [Lentisphaerae bacterium]|nr:VWA domain-containing protein [Lentisphaerota bacterium]
MNMRPFSVCVLAGALAAVAAAGAEEAGPAKQPGNIEVCFVLDTTGSMSGLIEGAKQKIWSIANGIVGAKPTPKVKFGLIGYRDRGDAYVTEAAPLTDDIDAIYEKLRGFRADGGGDTPESVNQALNEAVTQMTWSTNRSVLKIIFLVGDAPPHMDYKDDVKYPEVCRAAVMKDLIINTVQCGNMSDTTPVWQDIAAKSEGSYTAISQGGDMVAISTPVDKPIAELRSKIVSSRIGYGDTSAMDAEASLSVGFAATAPAPVAASRASYKAKVEGARMERVKAGDSLAMAEYADAALGGKADLAEAVVLGAVAMDKLEEDKLPEELRKMGKDEREAYLKEKVEERRALEKELSELNRQRDAYIAGEMKKRDAEGGKKGFDAEVERMVREQAARKGISYE